MSSLAGTAALVRLALRRDRIVLPVVIVVLVAMVAGSASATVELYPNTGSRVAAAAVNNATPTLALYGPINDATSIGALATFRMGLIGAISVAVLALFVVVRHARTEEETGHLEPGRHRARWLLPGAGDRRHLGRRRPRPARVALAGRLVATDAAVCRRQVVGARPPARLRRRDVRAGLRARRAAPSSSGRGCSPSSAS